MQIERASGMGYEVMEMYSNGNSNRNNSRANLDVKLPMNASPDYSSLQPNDEAIALHEWK